MIDNDQKYEALIKRLERVSREAPRAYKTQVALLAALGYGYLSALFVLALAAIAGIVAVFGFLLFSLHGVGAGIALAKIGIPLLAVLFGVCGAILKSLFVKLPPIEGPEIPRESAPRLFAMLDDVAAQLKAPRFHKVLISDDFNAGVLQLPRFGMLGSRNYLMIGVPLLKALSEKHFRAVIAHEFGHISQNHSRFSGWVYRQRISWMMLLHEVGHSPLIMPFLRWYVPYFNAYTFALARADEYVADNCGAELTGRQVMAEALMAIEIRGRYLQSVFWPKIFDRADHEPRPNVRPYTLLFEHGEGVPTAIEQAELFQKSWQARSDFDDPHPCLAERLSALGYRPIPAGPLDPAKPPLPLPEAPEVSAAQALLGGMAANLLAQFDQDWTQQVAQAWQEHHGKAQWGRQRLDALNRQSETEHLSLDEAMERAKLTGRFHGSEYAIPLIYQTCQAYPQDARPFIMMGMTMLNESNADGVAYLERAMAIDPKHQEKGRSVIAAFEREHGTAHRSQSQTVAAPVPGAEPQEDHTRIEPGDRLVPHGLPPQTLAAIKTSLAGVPSLRAAAVARKMVSDRPERPLFVVAVIASDGVDRDAAAADVRARLKLPGDVSVVVIDGQTEWLRKAIGALPGSLVFRSASA